MDAIKTWGLSVIFAVLSGGIFIVLFPNGSLKKIYETIVGVFVVCIMFSPLLNIDKDLIKETNVELKGETSIVQNQSEFNKTVVDKFESNVEDIFASRLSAQNISYEKIDVCTFIDDENRINISSVVVYSHCNSERDKQKFINDIKNDLMINTEFRSA